MAEICWRCERVVYADELADDNGRPAHALCTEEGQVAAFADEVEAFETLSLAWPPDTDLATIIRQCHVRDTREEVLATLFAEIGAVFAEVERGWRTASDDQLEALIGDLPAGLHAVVDLVLSTAPERWEILGSDIADRLRALFAA